MIKAITLLICVAAILPLRSSCQQRSGIDTVYQDHLFLHTDHNFYLAGSTIWMQLYCKMQKPADSLASSVGYVELIDTHDHQVVSKLKINIRQPGEGWVLLPDTLRSGKYSLWAYTSKSLSVGQGFKKDIVVQNTGQPVDGYAADSFATALLKTRNVHLQVYLNDTTCVNDQHFYNRRSPVQLEFLSSDSLSKPVPSRLSISVARFDSLQIADSSDILSILQAKPGLLPLQKPGFLEINGPIISGTVTDSSGNPGSTTLYVSIPGRKPRFYCVAAKAGKFAFEPYNFSGEVPIIIQTKESGYRVSVSDPFLEIAGIAHDTSTSTFKPYTPLQLDNLLDEHISQQVQNAFHGNEMYYIDDPYLDSLAFFGKADEEAILDDYTRFNTVEEVFREFVKTTMVRKRSDTLHLFTLDNLLTNPKFYDVPALVLLDGVPIFDHKKLFEIEPLVLRKVSVMARKIFYGPEAFNGIVSLQTYTGDLAGFKLDSSVQVFDYSGFALDREFYSPAYDKDKAETLPDRRSLLYWTANARSNQLGKTTIKFYTGDLPGTYQVTAQGIQENGEPCYSTFYFEVK